MVDNTNQPAATALPDYYIEHGRVVFTAAYHLRRGKCCGSGCRHCPYREPEPLPTTTTARLPKVV